MTLDLFEDGATHTSLVSMRKKKDGTFYTYDIRIDRGTIWGNPYSHLENSAAEYKTKTRNEAIEKYRSYILSNSKLLEKLPELKGKVLACWCVPKPWHLGAYSQLVCHGQILIELIHGTIES